MKRKLILALIATLTLTAGSFGTVFAMNGTPTIELQTNENLNQAEEPEHVHTWGDAYYVKDEDAKYESVKVVDQEAVYDEVKVVDQEAVYNDITERHQFCNVCNVDLTVAAKEAGMSITDYFYDVHQTETMHGGYHGDDVVVGQELVTPEISHMETVLVSPEKFHYEDKLVTPEKGHWEHTCTVCGEIQNSETGEVIKPGTLPDEPENPGTDDPTTEEPENPNPDDPTTEKPENPNPDDPTTEEPENPNTGDNTGDQTETPNEDTQNSTDKTETDSNKQEQQDNDKTTTTDTTDKSENTDTATTVSNENKAPQTGDTASLIYLATLAGSAVTGGTAFGLRRKFKK